MLQRTTKEDEDRAFIEAMVTWGDFLPTASRFRPDETASSGTLHDWLTRLGMPVSRGLLDNQNRPLTRAEAVQHLWRALQGMNESFPQPGAWLRPGEDDDGDGVGNLDDALPFDRDNNNLPDRLQPMVSS